jgi:hypothetical protein
MSPISIAGSGTITGISAGGLPDDCITTADIAAGAITDAKVNASAAIADSKLSGTTCKAWVNFNGTGAVAISASGNVSSITDNGTGDYTVNFTTALVDANFSAVVGIGGDSTSAGNGAWAQRIRSRTTSNIRLWTVRPDNGNLVDSSDANVAFFR